MVLHAAQIVDRNHADGSATQVRFLRNVANEIGIDVSVACRQRRGAAGKPLLIESVDEIGNALPVVRAIVVLPEPSGVGGAASFVG